MEAGAARILVALGASIFGVLGALHLRLLDRIAARDFDVATSRIDLGPIEKPWTAWRAARKVSS